MAKTNIWSEGEMAIIRAKYFSAGPSELLDLLPGRSWQAIRKKAHKMGLTSPENPRPRYLTEYDRPKNFIQQLEQDRRFARAKAEANHYKKLYNEALKALNIQDAIDETMREIALIIPKVSVKSISFPKSPIHKERGSETDGLQLSDLHGGEVVDIEETMGFAEYNMDILAKRLGRLFYKVIDLVNLRRMGLYIPKLAIFEQGDMLSGDIHPELIKTNVGHMMTIATRVAFMNSQGIAALSPHFEEIEVWCVVGNHARLYKKPYFKQKYVNWDYLCYQWQAVFCQSLDNVTFHIPRSPFALVEVENTKVLVMHGDSIRSWMGIPWYGIQRASNRLRALLQRKGEYFDALLLGHFHNRADIEDVTGPIIINSSLKGGDEYAIGSLQTMSSPSQNLLHFHEEYKYIGQEPIFLEKTEPRIEIQDYLPDTWVDLADEVASSDV